MTVIDKAIELVKKHGKEYAIKYFEDRIIDQKQQYKGFELLCQISGSETAIRYIKERL